MGLTRYHLDNNNTIEHTERIQLNLTPIYASFSKYEHDWPSILHSHPFVELFYVKSGCGSFLTDDEEHPITEGDFVVINANISHTEKSSETTPLEYISIGVKDVYFSFEMNESFTVFNCQNESKSLKFYMTSILNEIMHKERNYVEICQSLLEILLLQLMRWTNYSFQIESTTHVNSQCMKLKRYIDFHYAQNITLEDLATFTHLNKYYLSHAFSKNFGCSPIQYLCNVRIQNSKDLLANTDYTIMEIAHLSGFSSHSYFAQSFLKNCGMTASEYRKSCKAKKK